MNTERRLKNEVANRAAHAALVERDLLPYTDPLTLADGVERDDGVVVRGHMVSRNALYDYLRANEAHAQNGLALLWDGVPLTRAELDRLLDTDERSNMELDKTTIETGRKARTYVQQKIAHNIREMKAGTLRGGKGKHPLVKSRKQAIAIAFAQSRKAGRGGGRRRRK